MRAAFFADFTQNVEEEARRIGGIRERLGAECLIGVMSGNYLQNGLPSFLPARQRAGRALAAGADLVVRQSNYATLSSLGIYAFSGAKVLDKLGGVDVLALETEHASKEELEEIVRFLIANPREFQQKVGDYKRQGMPFYQAQAKAMGAFLPRGSEILNSRLNLFAVECIKSLKLMYSRISPVCVPVKVRVNVEETLSGKELQRVETALNGEVHQKEAALTEEALKRISDQLHYQLYLLEDELSDIYGGYEQLTERILQHREGFVDFHQFAGEVAGGKKDLSDVRKYFFRLLCHMKKSVVGIWRMYDFSPYCMVYWQKEARFEELARGSRICLLDERLAAGKGKALSQQEASVGAVGGLFDPKTASLERSKRNLLNLEERAEHLYRLQMGTAQI